MSDEFAREATPTTSRSVIVQRRSCLASLIGSLATIVVSAVLGAALAILFLFYGPLNLGLRLPDSTGRLAPLEHAQQTAVIERTEMRASLAGLTDIRSSFDALREETQQLETEIASRETNLDDLRAQIEANFDSLLALQRRLDELESIPANAAMAERLAEAELELATIRATLNRLREVFGAPPAPTSVRAPSEAATPADSTPGPSSEDEADGATSSR